MKQILDDYAPILNVTPIPNKLSNKKARKPSHSNKKISTTSNKRSRQGNKSTPNSITVKL